MKEIYKNLFIGSDIDCMTASRNNEFATIHACKTCHQKVLNYTKSLSSTHPNYLIYEHDNHLFLNMVDMSNEFSPIYTNPMIKVALDFINRNIPNKEILIHCNLGQSRSPSIGLVYLAIKGIINNKSYKDAISDFIKIYPDYNPGNGIALYLEHNWNSIINRDL